MVNKISLNKYIAACGVSSRRKADEFINSGLILVNNERPVDKYIDVQKDVVKYKDRVIKLEKKKIYIMLNKPVGIISSSKDNRGRKTVVDLVETVERVYPVGRLDLNSSGLIILTNDGDLSNELTHPNQHIEKEYIVTLDANVTDSNLDVLRNGVLINNRKTIPAIVKRINQYKFSIILKEGRNRQIRRMCEAIDLNVAKLKRIRIGKLKLGELKTGEYKTFDPNIFKL